MTIRTKPSWRRALACLEDLNYFVPPDDTVARAIKRLKGMIVERCRDEQVRAEH
jgi:hypothetical protein